MWTSWCKTAGEAPAVRENALTAALCFATFSLCDTSREMYALRGVSRLVRQAAMEALSRVRVVTEADIGVVVRAPTAAEDEAATAQVELEHAAWIAELKNARDKRAVVVHCLERRMTGRVDEVAVRAPRLRIEDKGAEQMTRCVEPLDRSQRPRIDRKDPETSARLAAAVGRASRVLRRLERGEHAARRCLESEMRQLRLQDQAIAAADARREAKLARARDPRRFYDADASAAAFGRLAACLPSLEVFSLDVPAAPHRKQFVLDEADRVCREVAAAPRLRVVRCRDVAATSPHCGIGLTDLGLAFSNLTCLSLPGCHAVTDAGVSGVVARSSQLVELDLRFCVGVGDGTLLALAAADCRRTLERLNVDRAYSGMAPSVHADYGPSCSDAGVVAVADRCLKLHTLHIRGYRPTHPEAWPPLSSAALVALAKAPALKCLVADGTCVGQDHAPAWRALAAHIERQGGTATTGRVVCRPPASY